MDTPLPASTEVTARLDLYQLVADYCFELDTTAGLNATLLMTEDVRMDLGAMQLSGHDEVRRFYEGFAAQVRLSAEGLTRVTRHVATNLRVALTDDEAVMDFIILNFSGNGTVPLRGGTLPTIVSDVRLDCRRGNDGRWRIAVLSGGPIFIGDDPLQNAALVGKSDAQNTTEE